LLFAARRASAHLLTEKQDWNSILSLPYLISARIAAGDSDLVDLPRESWNHFVEIVIEWSGLRK
jgi:hypothetical protein